jgi:hypothetical protein
MYPYTNTDMQGNPLPNFSSFRLCRFIFSDFIYDWPAETKQGLSLWGVDGLKIMGCEFINDATVDGTPVSNDATGIYSFDAGYWMNEECIDPTINPCPGTRLNSFEHLTYGIYAITDRPTKYISIDTATFTDCRTGIYMGAISTPKIIRCVFNSNTENAVFGSSDTTVGIYLEKCNQYFVEENTFTDHRETTQLSVGIHVLNSVPQYNEIYNNSFTGNYAGIVAAGENRDETGSGLCIKCNDFVSCDYDICVTADGGADEELLGIAHKQGDPLGGADNKAPAGNTFSKNTSEFNYYNDEECNPILYTMHEANNTEMKITPEPYYPEPPTIFFILNQNDETEYTKQEACPSHLNGSGLNTNSERFIVSSESLEINSYEDSLASTTDGGNTDNLNFEVQTSFPDEALLVRQQLLDESPYLSDTVMKSAIAKDDVLPNSMIRDVLVVNPQSAKSQEIVDMLDERIVPMDDYMMDEIMQGVNTYGAKELLEQALGLHKTKKAKSISKLIHLYKSDTSNYYSSNDSIIDLYESFPSFTTHLDLVLFFLDVHDSASASSILTSIPNIFNLSAEEEEQLDWYSDLLELQWQFCVNPVSVDTTLLQSLSDFMVNSDDLPEIYGRNILINQEEFNYLEPVYLPNIFKSTEITSPFTPSGNKKAYLKVFPNPAGRYFIIDYNTEHVPATSGIIRITDLSGRFSREINLIDNRNQIIVPTAGFDNGIYVVQVFINNRLADSIKINIIN